MAPAHGPQSGSIYWAQEGGNLVFIQVFDWTMSAHIQHKEETSEHSHLPQEHVYVKWLAAYFQVNKAQQTQIWVEQHCYTYLFLDSDLFSEHQAQPWESVKYRRRFNKMEDQARSAMELGLSP